MASRCLLSFRFKRCSSSLAITASDRLLDRSSGVVVFNDSRLDLMTSLIFVATLSRCCPLAALLSEWLSVTADPYVELEVEMDLEYCAAGSPPPVATPSERLF